MPAPSHADLSPRSQRRGLRSTQPSNRHRSARPPGRSALDLAGTDALRRAIRSEIDRLASLTNARAVAPRDRQHAAPATQRPVTEPLSTIRPHLDRHRRSCRTLTATGRRRSATASRIPSPASSHHLVPRAHTPSALASLRDAAVSAACTFERLHRSRTEAPHRCLRRPAAVVRADAAHQAGVRPKGTLSPGRFVGRL